MADLPNQDKKPVKESKQKIPYWRRQPKLTFSEKIKLARQKVQAEKEKYLEEIEDRVRQEVLEELEGKYLPAYRDPFSHRTGTSTRNYYRWFEEMPMTAGTSTTHVGDEEDEGDKEDDSSTATPKWTFSTATTEEDDSSTATPKWTYSTPTTEEDEPAITRQGWQPSLQVEYQPSTDGQENVTFVTDEYDDVETSEEYLSRINGPQRRTFLTDDLDDDVETSEEYLSRNNGPQLRTFLTDDLDDDVETSKEYRSCINGPQLRTFLTDDLDDDVLDEQRAQHYDWEKHRRDNDESFDEMVRRVGMIRIPNKMMGRRYPGGRETEYDRRT